MSYYVLGDSNVKVWVSLSPRSAPDRSQLMTSFYHHTQNLEVCALQTSTFCSIITAIGVK